MAATKAFSIPEMPSKDYHGHPSLSRSRIKKFIDSRDAFAHAFRTGRWGADDTSDALVFGCALHQVALEGLTNSVIQIPQNVLTKAGARNGKAWDDFEDECLANCLIPLKEQPYQELKGMVEALQKHPRARELLFGGNAVVEESIFWRDQDTHLDLRCRPDIRTIIGGYFNVIVDLKGMADVSPQAFAKSIASHGYDIQNYLYQSGVKEWTGADYAMVFVCVQKTWPHTVRCYQLNDEFAEMARSKTVDALEEIAQCKATGNWNEPGWDKVLTLPPPSWLKYTNQWEIDNGDGD